MKTSYVQVKQKKSLKQCFELRKSPTIEPVK